MSIYIFGGSYLLMRFDGPIDFDLVVTEITDLLEHGSHEGRAELLGVGGSNNFPLLIKQALPTSLVVVE